MPFLAAGAGIGAIGSIVGAGKQADATKQAAQMQTQAATHASDLQNAQFIQTRQTEAPFMDAGANAVGQIMSGMPGFMQGFDPTNAGLAANFSYDPTSFQNDPAFTSTMKLGQDAIQRAAAAKGQALSPATLKSLEQFGIDTGNQFYNQDYNRAQQTYQQNYGNAFNTFTNNQNSAFSKLAQIANLGQNAAAGTGQLGAQSATAQGNALMSGANSASAGVIGGANAFNNGMAGVSANLMQLLGNPQFQGWAKGNSSSYGSGQSTDGFGGLKF